MCAECIWSAVLQCPEIQAQEMDPKQGFDGVESRKQVPYAGKNIKSSDKDCFFPELPALDAALDPFPCREVDPSGEDKMFRLPRD